MKYAWMFFMASLVTGVSVAQVPVELAKNQQALLRSADQHLAANKKLVFDFWREVIQATDLTRAADYMTADFKEHNPTVPSGLKGFLDHFRRVFTSPAPVKPTIDDLVDVVAEHDLVILVLRKELDDPNHPGHKYSTTWFDMFRVTGGKISEHWDYGTLGK